MEGGGVLGAAQEVEPRAAAAAEEEKAGAAAERRAAGGGGMKFRVCARAPHGVGALLLIGGAALVGAAVVAWRHAHRRGGKDHQRDRQPAKEEVLGGGVEDGKDRVSAPEIDLSDENLRGEKTEIGSHGLDGEVVEEIQQINNDNKIGADKPDSELVEKYDDSSKRNPTEVPMHDVHNEHVNKLDQNSSMKPDEIITHDMDNKYVQKFYQNPSTKPAEITTHDMDSENVERGDNKNDTENENSSKNDAEDANSSKNDTENENSTKNDAEDENSSKNDTEDENSTKNDLENLNSTKNDIENDNSTKNDTENENSTMNIKKEDNEDDVSYNQSNLSVSGPGIALHKHRNPNDGAEEAESMENTPTMQLMMHQEQLLDDMMTDAVTETALAKLAEGKIIDKSEVQQVEKKVLEELVQLVSSQALSSLVKPIEKKEPELPGPFETGMKMEQDRRTNGKLTEHDLSRTGAMPGGAVVTVDRWSVSMTIVALMFAVAIGITIIVRLYAPPRAMKLQMDSQ